MLQSTIPLRPIILKGVERTTSLGLPAHHVIVERERHTQGGQIEIEGAYESHGDG
jgi:hypothetical protein